MTEAPRSSPDSLDELERRVYDLAVQPIPLAEMAVRLGVPVAQADEKLQRLLLRMGVPDRATLRNGGIPPAVPREDTAADAQEPEVAPGPPPPPSRLSRRAVLLGGASAVALAGGAAAGFNLASRRNSATSSALDTPTPITLTTPTPITLPFGGLPIQEEPGRGSRFALQRFTPKEEIAWQHGLFKMDIRNGDIEAFRFLQTADDDFTDPRFWSYTTGFGGRFVSALHGESSRSYLADWTNEDRSWSWPSRALRLIAAFDAQDRSHLVFEELTGPRDHATGRYHCFVVDPGGEPEHVGVVETAPAEVGTPTLTHASGGIIVWSGGSTAQLEVHLLDPYRASIVHSRPVVAPGSGTGAATPLDIQPINRDRFLVRWRLPGPSFATSGAVLSWTDPDTWNSPTQFRMEWSTSIDPSGKLIVEEHTQRLEHFEESREYWPQLIFRPLDSPEPIRRWLSAATSYGDWHPPNRWLADGSGFVAMVRGPETDGANFDAYEYAIISPQGDSVTRLRPPPFTNGANRWFHRNSIRGALPSPYNPGLIAFGRLEFYDLTRDNWYRANITSDEGPDHLDPWVAGPEFLTFALPHGGHGGASPPILLNLKVEESPWVDRFDFVVAGTGDSLRLREAPGLDAPILTTLPDGTPLSLAEDATQPPGRQSAATVDMTRWLHVRTASGQTGWVSSTYLEWQ